MLTNNLTMPMAGLGRADHEGLAGGVDYLLGDGVQIVDLKASGDLGEQSLPSRKLPPVIRAMDAMACVSVKSASSSVRPSLRQCRVRTKESSSPCKGR